MCNLYNYYTYLTKMIMLFSNRAVNDEYRKQEETQGKESHDHCNDVTTITNSVMMMMNLH